MSKPPSIPALPQAVKNSIVSDNAYKSGHKDETVSRKIESDFATCAGPIGKGTPDDLIARACYEIAGQLAAHARDSSNIKYGRSDLMTQAADAMDQRSCFLGENRACERYRFRLAHPTNLAVGGVIQDRVYDPPLIPVPVIPEELAKHIVSAFDRDTLIPGCNGGDFDLKRAANDCESMITILDLGETWATKHGYSDELKTLRVQFAERACSLGAAMGCLNYYRAIESSQPIEATRIRSLPACQTDDFCRTDGRSFHFTEEKKHTALDVMNAVNASLGAVNDTLEQHNQEVAAQNDARMQQVQTQVAANDARRAQQTYTKTFSGETSNGAIRKETLVGNNSTGWTDTIQCFAPGANLPYDSFTRSGPTEFIQNIPACPAPPAQPTIATTPSPTAAPPVPYQKPPSTGGTVVSSATLCPASGYTFTSYGDAATGVPCTPGQPIKTAGGSGGSSSGSGTGSGSGGSAGGLGFQSIPPVFNCIAQSYVHDDLTFTNNCNVPLYVTWWIGGHSGGWTIDPGTSNGTGYTGADVAAGGGDTFYVCPKGASPVDGSGRVLTSAASNYTCRAF